MPLLLAETHCQRQLALPGTQTVLLKSPRNLTSLVLTYCQWLDLLLHLQKSIKIGENPAGENSTILRGCGGCPGRGSTDTSWIGMGVRRSWAVVAASWVIGGDKLVSLSSPACLSELSLPPPAGFSCLKVKSLNCKGLWFCLKFSLWVTAVLCAIGAKRGPSLNALGMRSGEVMLPSGCIPGHSPVVTKQMHCLGWILTTEVKGTKLLAFPFAVSEGSGFNP